MKLVKENLLRQISENLFITKNVKKNIYESVINCLIETSLRGVDSHGIRLLPHYLKVIDTGRINIKPNIISFFF